MPIISMMSFLGFIFSALILLWTNSYAVAAPLQFQTVNVFSGYPQISDEPKDSGGFGDIAANLAAALALKQQNPQLKVRFLVTSNFKRISPYARTTDEVMKIMAPELDPTKKGVLQNYKGIQVVFLDYDFYRLIVGFPKWLVRSASWLVSPDGLERKRAVASLKKLIPPSDLNINFAEPPEAGFILQINTGLAIGVEEQFGSSDPINEIFAGNSNTPPLIELSSGPASVGFMLPASTDSAVRRRIIEKWCAESGVELSPNWQPITMYSSDPQINRLYLTALTQIDLPLGGVLFVKKNEGVDLSSLQGRIRVVSAPSFPQEVLDALLQESVLSPLVTGDISLGQGLASTSVSKSFIYEVRPWKVDSAARLRWMLAKDLNVRPSTLAPMFLTSGMLSKLEGNKFEALARDLANFMGDMALQRRLHEVISQRLPQWNLLRNVMSVADTMIKRTEFDPQSVAGQIRTMSLGRDAKPNLINSCGNLFDAK